jgi:sulfite reductase beta subunit-like hemoprotein
LAALASDCGAPFVRLLPTQDLLIPCVHRSMLPAVYARLRGALASVDLTFASYKGHLTTCVGACVCKIGMADAPAVGDRIAAELDRYLPADTPEKRALLRVAADDLRLSGCPNACSGHPAARIGVGCILQKADGEIRTFMHVLTGAGVTDGVPRLAVGVEEAAPLPLEDGVRAVVDACLAAAHGG